MEYSRLSKIISTTSRLEHFTPESTAKFRECLVKHLQCSDERAFLSKVLLLVYKSLSSESISQLKDVAIELSSQNAHAHSNDQPAAATEGNISNNNHRTQTTTSTNICTSSDCTDSHMKNYFSLLSGDTINIIGSFLCKNESVRVGRVNRYMLCETQKRSYLLKRENTNQEPPQRLAISSLSVKHLRYAYSFPLVLQLIGSKRGNRSLWQERCRSAWFKTKFTRLKRILCSNTAYLPCLPVNLLFNKNKHRDDVIELFAVDGGSWDCSSDLDQFARNYSKYFDSECSSNAATIRRIDTLRVSQNSQSYHGQPGHGGDVKSLLLALRGNYSKLDMSETSSLTIANIDEYEAIFHSNLEQLYIGHDVDICLDSSLQVDASEIVKKRGAIGCQNLSFFMLKTVCSKHKMLWMRDQVRRNFDSFRARRNVTTMRGVIKPPKNGTAGTLEADHFGKLLFDPHACPKLRQVKIVFEHLPDTEAIVRSLPGLCCMFLMHIGGESYDCAPAPESLEKVVIRWEFSQNATARIAFGTFGQELEWNVENEFGDMQLQRGVQVYDCEAQSVEVKDCDFSKESIKKLYRDLVVWFVAINARMVGSGAKATNREVVLHVNRDSEEESDVIVDTN